MLAKREALVHQLDHDIYLGDAVGEFNSNLAKAQISYKSPWTNWFYASWIMEIEPITFEGGTKMNELKPCPFCGSKVAMTYSSRTNTFKIWHEGEKCELTEPIQIDANDTVDSLSKATEVWNRRTE